MNTKQDHARLKLLQTDMKEMKRTIKQLETLEKQADSLLNELPENERKEILEAATKPIDNSHKQMPITKSKTIGRNQPCSCGSGVKYKKCCGK